MQFIGDFEDFAILGTIALSAQNVARKTGLTEAAVYKLTETGALPQSIWLSPGRRAWLADEIEAWLQRKIADRRPPPSAMHRRGRDKKDIKKPARVFIFPNRDGESDGPRAA